jgi:uncharacterized protein
MPSSNVLTDNSSAPRAPAPWWKEPYVWMVISGPLSAVIACIVTGIYIMQGPDAVVAESAYPAGREISKKLENASPSMQPARSGRNHSATQGVAHEKR